MKDYKNILLINYGGLGDEILFLSAISSLKKQYPNAKITLALEDRAKSIKDLTEDIDEVICVNIKEKGFRKYLNILKFIFSLRKKNFDCVISSGKSPFVALILFLTGIKERIGYDSKTGFLLTKKVSLKTNTYAAKMYHSLVEPIVEVQYQDPFINLDNNCVLAQELTGEYICVHPGVSKMSISKKIFKCPSLPFWLGLIEGILDKNKKIVLLGANDDKDLIEEILNCEKITKNPNFINFFNKTKNIKEMAHIMKNAKKVICVDSAPMHVAIALKADTIAIFGPTDENKLTPKRENIKIIKNDIPCRPCLWDKRAFNCENSECLDIDFNVILNQIN